MGTLCHFEFLISCFDVLRILLIKHGESHSIEEVIVLLLIIHHFLLVAQPKHPKAYLVQFILNDFLDLLIVFKKPPVLHDLRSVEVNQGLVLLRDLVFFRGLVIIGLGNNHIVRLINWLNRLRNRFVLKFEDFRVEVGESPLVVLFVHLVVDHVEERHAFPDVPQVLVVQRAHLLLLEDILHIFIDETI